MKIVSDDGIWCAVVEEQWSDTSTPCIGCGRKPTGEVAVLQPMRSAFALCGVCVDTLMDLKARADEGMY